MREGSQGASTWLLLASAAILAIGAGVHGFAYAKAAAVAQGSTLPPFFQAVFRGLWLSDCLSSLLLAVALTAIAAKPTLAAKPLVALLALTPLAVAVVLFLTMGNFFASYFMVTAAVLTLLAAVLRPGNPQTANSIERGIHGRL